MPSKVIDFECSYVNNRSCTLNKVFSSSIIYLNLLNGLDTRLRQQRDEYLFIGTRATAELSRQCDIC